MVSIFRGRVWLKSNLMCKKCRLYFGLWTHLDEKEGQPRWGTGIIRIMIEIDITCTHCYTRKDIHLIKLCLLLRKEDQINNRIQHCVHILAD